MRIGDSKMTNEISDSLEMSDWCNLSDKKIEMLFKTSSDLREKVWSMMAPAYLKDGVCPLGYWDTAEELFEFLLEQHKSELAITLVNIWFGRRV